MRMLSHDRPYFGSRTWIWVDSVHHGTWRIDFEFLPLAPAVFGLHGRSPLPFDSSASTRISQQPLLAASFSPLPRVTKVCSANDENDVSCTIDTDKTR
jgi:hypothetical protein